MRRLTVRQRAVAERFLRLAEAAPALASVYARAGEPGELLHVWAVVPKWSWSSAAAVSDLALVATAEDHTAPVVFDILSLEGRSEADIERATMGGERVYVRG